MDVFTPLVYASKIGRPPEWSRELLEATPAFVPRASKVQLILDQLDFPASLASAAASTVPSWGIQLFGGARAFADGEGARAFRQGVEAIRARCGRDLRRA